MINHVINYGLKVVEVMEGVEPGCKEVNGTEVQQAFLNFCYVQFVIIALSTKVDRLVK